MSTFRYLDENLKNKWKGINDDVPVNSSMYVFVTEDEEKKFVDNMYPTEIEKKIISYIEKNGTKEQKNLNMVITLYQ